MQNSNDQPTEIKTSDAQATNDPSQEELERLYQEQMRRLSCPGCGETEIF